MDFNLEKNQVAEAELLQISLLMDDLDQQKTGVRIKTQLSYNGKLRTSQNKQLLSNESESESETRESAVRNKNMSEMQEEEKRLFSRSRL